MVGFGKGDWKLAGKDQMINKDKMLLFKLSTMDDMVQFNNRWMSLQSVIGPKGSKNTATKIKYHSMHDVSSGMAGSFSLTVDHEVYFAPDSAVVEEEGGADAEDATGNLQQTVGALVPKDTWTSHCTAIQWAVKWTVNGLSPVRPLVMLTTDLTLMPGRSVLLY